MKQTDRVPHKARGAAQSAGVPAERAGVPAESAGVPAESAGTTKTSYPLMKYLSLLLAVTLLFSGVTFARYLSNDRIDSSVGIAAFDATYSIDRVNTTTFGNQDYWIPTGNSGSVPQGENTAITVGITLKNNGDTAVHPTLHLEGPADYWDNIALQFSTSRNIAVETVLTPQFVIADLLKERTVDPDQTGDKYDILYGEYKNWDTVTEETENTWNTAESVDFGVQGEVTASLTMNGGLTKDDDGTVGGSVTATWGESNENTLTISASKAARGYAVGFVRESNEGVLSPIFVNCKREMTVYSIDLDLGALSLAAKQGETASEQPLVLWLTWTDAAPNNSQAANEQFWNNLAAGTPFPITSNGNKIDITGYHFDVSGVPVVPVVNADGKPVVDADGNPTGEITTIRVQQTLGVDESGNSQLQTEYFHVASIDESEEDGAYAHPLTPVTVEGKEDIYRCDNGLYVDLSAVDTTFDTDDLDMIRYETVVDADTEPGTEPDPGTSITYAPIQQRAFGVDISVIFVQTSELP